MLVIKALRLTLDIPEDVLFRRSGVQDVEPNCVHTILLHHLLRVQTVVFRFTHLLPRHFNRSAAQRHWLFTWGSRRSV